MGIVGVDEHGWGIASTVLALALATSPADLHAQATTTMDSIGQLIVADRTAAEMLFTSAPGWGSGDRQFDIGRGPAMADAGSSGVWRGVVGNHAYLVVERDGKIFRAGGFHETDLLRIAPLVASEMRCAESLTTLAECLAVLADPFAAQHVLCPSGDGARITRIVGLIRQEEATGWPEDIVASGSNGEVAVVITVLSQNLGNLPQSWSALAYTFIFDDGALITWNRRERSLLDIGDP